MGLEHGRAIWRSVSRRGVTSAHGDDSHRHHSAHSAVAPEITVCQAQTLIGLGNIGGEPRHHEVGPGNAAGFFGQLGDLVQPGAGLFLTQTGSVRVASSEIPAARAAERVIYEGHYASMARNVRLILGPTGLVVFGTWCSHTSWVFPRISSKLPWQRSSS